jgi:hypothetical protein
MEAKSGYIVCEYALSVRAGQAANTWVSRKVNTASQIKISDREKSLCLIFVHILVICCINISRKQCKTQKKQTKLFW